MNIFIGLTACKDQDTKIWSLKSKIYFSYVLHLNAAQKLLRYLPLLAMHMHHPMEGHRAKNYSVLSVQ